MTGKIIDGKATALAVREKVAEDVAEMVAAGKPKPGLATVLVGEDPASQVYVRSKIKACEKAGIESFGHKLPETATQEEVEGLVKELNADPQVNGILVQLPLPDGLDEEKVLQAINLEKDVDGFHPVNIGRLAQKGRESLFVPCTPAGIMYLLGETGVQLEGAEAVVLGRSNIVGMPVALLLVKSNATVTICHSRTRDLPGLVAQADILVGAVGKPEFIKADWVKAGAVVVDAGYHPGGVGDVELAALVDKVSAYTPVPGGVGPMTINTLIMQSVQSGEKSLG